MTIFLKYLVFTFLTLLSPKLYGFVFLSCTTFDDQLSIDIALPAKIHQYKLDTQDRVDNNIFRIHPNKGDIVIYSSKTTPLLNIKKGKGFVFKIFDTLNAGIILKKGTNKLSRKYRFYYNEKRKVGKLMLFGKLYKIKSCNYEL